ncbi:type III secretion system export apparatus subunit SctR [Rhabdaerophilum sp. SD176]|uniref:type III secretion system export apparatus subunit SctR n=1 Tax=Rhabdaerophilum sp. SD176 TaxID=2983548 RepID=UPI0024DFAE28|nr:type III secretion system export apparatus subunit SctR [Rhabdaerophilum sp. SD176]
MNLGENTFGLLILVAGLAFLPLVAVTVTAFAKVAIVLFIVRNAIGIQQLPPNIIVYGLSLILSVYIAMPVLEEAWRSVAMSGLKFTTFSAWEEAARQASAPLQAFLRRFTDDRQLAFFMQSTAKIWGGEKLAPPSENALSILVPAFLLSELTRAFEIGFLLYLPFMAIDIIVTAILVALGMMQIQPTTIAIPFKLLLFVLLDGWTKIVQGLVLTYA